MKSLKVIEIYVDTGNLRMYEIPCYKKNIVAL